MPSQFRPRPGPGALSPAWPGSPPFRSRPRPLAAPAPQRIGGTWDLTWRNRRGEIRKGSMVIEQRGAQLFAEVYDRGGATATGSISGSSFTLQGRRLALPFTVTGRVQGRKMTGTLVGARESSAASPASAARRPVRIPRAGSAQPWRCSPATAARPRADSAGPTFRPSSPARAGS